MQKNNKLILGGGTTGLLYAFYNKDYHIITEQIGGQFSAKFQLGPKYIHVDKHSKKLFSDLKLNPKTKTVKIGFFYDQALHSENTAKHRKMYFEKTRGLSTSPYSTSQTSDKTEFQAYDIDPDTLVQILTDKIEKDRIVLDSVKKINLKEHSLTTKQNGVFEYEHLVSTIPLNVFCNLANETEIAETLQYRATTFLKHTGTNIIWAEFEKEIEKQGFDYVYFPEEKTRFHRVTKTKDGFVYEKVGDIDAQIPEPTIVIPVGQLINTDEKIEFPKVTFLGRYAKWQHGILINNVLQEIYER